MRFITFAEAMRSQPDALTSLEHRLDESEWPSGVAPWLAGDTVALVAMGAAHHSTHALAHALRAGGIRALDIAASELVGASGAALGDHALIVSESGRSPEPIAVARLFPRGRRLVVTNEPSAAVSEVADAILDLGGFPDSQAYTVGFTATLVAYDRLLRQSGIATRGTAAIADAVAVALETFSGAVAEHAASLVRATSVDVVGSGAGFAAAAEIALLIREGLRRPAAAYETGQYLHGPMESVGPGTTVVILGDGRERAIPDSLTGSGADVIVIGRDNGSAPPHIEIGDVKGFSRVAVEVVAGQSLIAAAADLVPFEIEEFLRSQPDTKI